MTIVQVTRSPEPCAEAGWMAFQYYLERPVSRDFILGLRPLGSFVFLEGLSRPFFKIESEHYMIKGLLGDDSVRVAVHGQHLDEQAAIQERIQTL